MSVYNGLLEYIKPGEARETLKLNADGTCEYQEVMENNLEKKVTTGKGGKWKVDGQVVVINFDELHAKWDVKMSGPAVPKSGENTHTNITLPNIPLKALTDPPGHGTHKWRKAQQ